MFAFVIEGEENSPAGKNEEMQITRKNLRLVQKTVHLLMFIVVVEE